MKKRVAPGFTLIELMIVVVVLSLLAVVAFPSYRDHVRKAKRAEAKTALLKAAQLQERFFSDQNRYANQAELRTAMAVTGGTIYSGENPNSSTGSYTLTVALTGTPATAYVLTATPTGSHQDAECGNLTITERGVRCWSTSGTAPECSGTPANAARCRW